MIAGDSAQNLANGQVCMWGPPELGAVCSPHYVASAFRSMLWGPGMSVMRETFPTLRSTRQKPRAIFLRRKPLSLKYGPAGWT